MNTNKILDVSVWIITESRHESTVLNALGRGFDLDEVDIASPTGRPGPSWSPEEIRR
jgi:hypothetical protein